MKLTVSVEGLRELDAGLAELSKATARRVLQRTLVKAAQPMVELAARLAPDDPETGPPDLHSSVAAGTRIKNEVGKAAFARVLEAGGSRAEARAALRDARRAAGGEGSFAEAYVGPTASSKRAAIKAIVQEFGSVKQSARPYMRPAFEGSRMAVLEGIRANLGEEIAKAAARARARAARLLAKTGG